MSPFWMGRVKKLDGFLKAIWEIILASSISARTDGTAA